MSDLIIGNRTYSPTGRVPILRHGDNVIWDSLAIGEYLAELFPAAALWPEARRGSRSGPVALRRDALGVLRDPPEAAPQLPREGAGPRAGARTRGRDRPRRGSPGSKRVVVWRRRSISVRPVHARRRVFRARGRPVPHVRRSSRGRGGGVRRFGPGGSRCPRVDGSGLCRRPPQPKFDALL